MDVIVMTMRLGFTVTKPTEGARMNPLQIAHIDVPATVIEVLPSMGLAWLRDAEMREWAVTKSTPGVEWAQLAPGSRVCLHVCSVDGKEFPCGCHT